MSFGDEIVVPLTGKFKPREEDIDLAPDEVLGLRAKPVPVAPTGWLALDSRLRRGGLPMGSVCALVGPPESGKTFLSLQLLLGLSNTMMCVGLYSDWGRDAATDILAIMEGAPRQDVDSNPLGVQPYLREKIGKRTIVLRKTDTDESTVSGLFDLADTLWPCAVFIDSIQSCDPGNIEGFEDAHTDYTRNRTLTRYIRSRAARRGHIVVMTSESNRGRFKFRNAQDNTTAISAASGGGVEYAMDLMVVLSRPENGAEDRQVEIAKNRLADYTKHLPRVFSVRHDPYGRVEEISEEEAKQVALTKIDEKELPVRRCCVEFIKQEFSTKGHKPNQTEIFNHVRGKLILEKPSRHFVLSVLAKLSALGGPLVSSPGPTNSVVYEPVNQ